MLASEVKAVIAGFVVVCVAGVGAVVWRQQHPDSEIARLTEALPPASAPQPAKPKGPPAPAPAASKAPAAPPTLPNLGPGPTDANKEPPAGRGEPPHFDVVRVERNGETVIAGKGDPNAKVDLLASGKVVAETTADAAGNFVILPPAMVPGSYDLTLRQSTTGQAPIESKQSVAVSVPAPSSGQVVVAMAEPGKPTRLIGGPPSAPAATGSTPSPAAPAAVAPPEGGPPGVAPPAVAKTPPAPAQSTAAPQTAVTPPAAIKPAEPGLVIRSVELENGNGFFASGAAAPGTRVQIYLNGSHLAEVVAGPDGQWSVTIRKGLTGGHYAVRADATDDAQRVVARVEVPFDVPVTMAEAPKPEASKPEPPKPAQEAAPAAPVATPEPSAKVAVAPVDRGPAPPTAPNPDEVAGLGPEAPPASAPPPVVPPPAAPPPEQMPSVAATTTPEPAKVPPSGPSSEEKPSPSAPHPSASAERSTPPQPAHATAPTAPPAPAAAVPATPPGPQQADAGKPATPSANAVIEQVQTALVVPGDNLWNISRTRLGLGRRFTEVYAANVSQIRDPKLIYPGQVFVVPTR